jgi:hypothetical protein
MIPADLTNGRYYVEFTLHDPALGSGTVAGTSDSLGPFNEMTGVGLTAGIVDAGAQGADDFIMFSDGSLYSAYDHFGNVPVAFAPGNCNIGMAVGGGKWWVRINGGPWNGSSSADPVAGTGGIAVPSSKTKYFMAEVGYWQNFGVAWMSVNTAGPFLYAPPTGYRTWPNPPAVGDGFDPYTIRGSVPLYTNSNQGISNTPGSGYTVNRSNSAIDLTAVFCISSS